MFSVQGSMQPANEEVPDASMNDAPTKEYASDGSITKAEQDAFDAQFFTNLDDADQPEPEADYNYEAGVATDASKQLSNVVASEKGSQLDLFCQAEIALHTSLRNALNTGQIMADLGLRACDDNVFGTFTVAGTEVSYCLQVVGTEPPLFIEGLPVVAAPDDRQGLDNGPPHSRDWGAKGRDSASADNIGQESDASQPMHQTSSVSPTTYTTLPQKHLVPETSTSQGPASFVALTIPRVPLDASKMASPNYIHQKCDAMAKPAEARIEAITDASRRSSNSQQNYEEISRSPLSEPMKPFIPSDPRPFPSSNVESVLPLREDTTPKCYVVNKPSGCRWGINCHYSHTLEGQVCKFVQYGQLCPRVATCLYKHDVSPAMAQADRGYKSLPGDDEFKVKGAATKVQVDGDELSARGAATLSGEELSGKGASRLPRKQLRDAQPLSTSTASRTRSSGRYGRGTQSGYRVDKRGGLGGRGAGRGWY